MIDRRRLLALTSAALVGAVTGCSARPDDAGVPPSGPAGASGSSEWGGSAASSASASPSISPEPDPESGPESSASTTGAPKPRVTDTIAADLDVPWGLAFLPSGDALVSERNTGAVLRISPSGRTRTVGEVRGVDAARGSGEGGLLGLAVDPTDSATVFAYLSTSGDNRVVRLRLAGSSGSRIADQRPVLTGIPRSVHHNGGRLLVDGDGLLYVSTGDAERRRDAQDRDSLAGKILRIRPDGRAAPGNPFGNRVYSYGHRNVEGLALDGAGRLWATEFGDKQTDELNLIRPGGNYGWPQVEGSSSSSRYRSPAASWSPTSSCSPAGVVVAGGVAFVAALRGQCLFAVPLTGTRAGRPRRHLTSYGRLRTVAAAPDGSLWVTTSNTDGRIEPGRRDDKILRVEW